MVLATVLLGTFYAATDGVLTAMASALLPEEVRGTGLAALVTATSTGRMLASILFGALWTAFGYEAAVAAFVVVLLSALADRDARPRADAAEGEQCVTERSSRSSSCAPCALAASVAYVARGGAQDDGGRSAQAGSAADVNAKDTIVFRNLDRKNVSRYGFTAVARIDSPGSAQDRAAAL